MATNFPTSLDSYTTKVDNVDSVLAAHINNPQDAIVALQTKVGVNSSGAVTSHDYLLRNLPAQGADWNAGASRQLSCKNYVSVVGTGTAPFTVTSTTLCANLNADLLDNQQGTYYLNVSNMTAGTLAIARGGTGSATRNFVDLSSTESIAGIKTFASSPIVPLTPTTSTQAASKGYVDTQILTGIVGMGNPTAKSAGTIYQAATDGFLVGNSYDPTPQGNGFIVYSDSSSTPSTMVMVTQTLWVSGAPIMRMAICCPIKKNNYYQVRGLNLNGSIDDSKIERLNFIPFGS